jgi:hypothetical protein
MVMASWVGSTQFISPNTPDKIQVLIIENKLDMVNLDKVFRSI